MTSLPRRAYPLLLTPLAVLLAFLLFPVPRQVPYTIHDYLAIVCPALPQERALDLTERVLVRLERAEKKEPDQHLKSDIRIAWVTTLYASQDNPNPHVDATYRVLGLHPDKVWSALVARRKAKLGREYSLWYDANDNPRQDPFPTVVPERRRSTQESDAVDVLGAVKKPCKGTKRERRKAA